MIKTQDFAKAGGILLQENGSQTPKGTSTPGADEYRSQHELVTEKMPQSEE